ncbi:MAG: efflux transporter outer membrane subunit [Deltaproteobacteria bacterium]|nr:efflux transporter outer membrane subunit [Deltaproteobacteria bacterium]MBW2067413.1 efflux transporter outer membrane subunit [Deltaproteobacteria bacterium]
MIKSTLVIMITVFFTISCATVGPDYSKPSVKLPVKWHRADGVAISQKSQMDVEKLAKWWEVLGDPILTSLEEEAVQGNLDVKIALARIREARALAGVQEAELYPTVDASGSYSRQRSSSGGRVSNFFSLGLDSSWEIDLFGGIRRSIEAAIAELEAAEAGLFEVLVTLTAEVALNYVTMRTYQARLDVAEKNIKIQQETYELNRSKYEAGLVDELAVQQALYNLEHTKSLVPSLKTGIEQAKNRLALLLGKQPQEIDKLVDTPASVPKPPVKLMVGIPAAVIKQRPDIRRAERELAAATAQIGAVKSELYPKLRLYGSIGLESLRAGDLFEWASRVWRMGPGVSWKVFDAGAIRKNVQAQKARRDQAFYNYELSILKALQEVEDVLVAFAQEEKRKYALVKAVEAAMRAEQLARDRYDAGLVDFTTVLEAQRALQSFQDELVQSNGAVASNFIRLYKALGGGWQSWKAQDNVEERISSR